MRKTRKRKLNPIRNWRRPLTKGEKRDIEAGIREAADPSKLKSYDNFDDFLADLDKGI